MKSYITKTKSGRYTVTVYKAKKLVFKQCFILIKTEAYDIAAYFMAGA